MYFQTASLLIVRKYLELSCLAIGPRFDQPRNIAPSV